MPGILWPQVDVGTNDEDDAACNVQQVQRSDVTQWRDCAKRKRCLFLLHAASHPNEGERERGREKENEFVWQAGRQEGRQAHTLRRIQYGITARAITSRSKKACLCMDLFKGTYIIIYIFIYTTTCAHRHLSNCKRHLSGCATRANLTRTTLQLSTTLHSVRYPYTSTGQPPPSTSFLVN